MNSKDNLGERLGDVSTISGAWVFTMNHGIDDQQSVNIIIKDLLDAIHETDIYTEVPLEQDVTKFEFPKSIEQAIGGAGKASLKTMFWAAYQLANSLQQPVVLPKKLLHTLRSSRSNPSPPLSELLNPSNRRTIIETFQWRSEDLLAIRNECKSRKMTITHILAAFMLCASAVFVNGESGGGGEDGANGQPLEGTGGKGQVAYSEPVDTLRFLLSVGLRPYGDRTTEQAGVSGGKSPSSSDFTGGTVACAGGAVDFCVKVTAKERQAYRRLIQEKHSPGAVSVEDLEGIWELARHCQKKANFLFENDLVPESVRLFDFGMRLIPILQAVEMDAGNPETLGRGYTCGVSNVGVVDFLVGDTNKGAGERLAVEAVYYGTSHARNGVLLQLSCQTVKNRLCGCLQFPYPIVSEENAALVSDNLSEAVSRFAEKYTN